MATTQPRPSARPAFDLAELSLELARLDLSRGAKLGEQVVDLLARYFSTNRVSIVLYSEKEHRLLRAYFTGFDIPLTQWDQPRVIEEVCTSRKALLSHDVTEDADLFGRTGQYRTNACAVYPLVFQKKLLGALCLSNLSSQLVMQLENSPAALEIVLAQVAQVARLDAQASHNKPVRADSGVDELALIGRLLEKLEGNVDMRDAISVFGEVIGELVPTEVIAVIHDRVKDSQLGVIDVRREVHVTELENVFNAIAQQWQRRHKRAPSLNFSDARVLGQELICREGDCTPELKLQATEVFPIFLDNDLFAIVCLATTEEALSDRRLLMAFNVMAHQLFTFVKKRLLLAQNSEMQTVDSLTGLYNERQFYQMLEREFDRAKRYNVALSLLFVDIDHFKDINDSYGFETGDQVLLDLARIITENMRNTDFVSRYSGERFVVVLPETPYKNADIMANRLRRYVENHSFFIPNTNVFVKVTASIGVASYLDHKPASVAQFIEYADTALYFAKRNGRNQVVGYSYVINLMCGDTKHKG